jgi:hypothetical protein
VKHIRLRDLDVSRIGLGAMGMSHGYTGAGSDDEQSVGTIHRAHAVHPVTAVQSEYSLRRRDRRQLRTGRPRVAARSGRGHRPDPGRPDLSQRDRSLITVAAVSATTVLAQVNETGTDPPAPADHQSRKRSTPCST